MECYTVVVRRPLGDRVYHNFEVQEGDDGHDDGAGLLNSGLERKEVVESSNASTVHSHMFSVLVTDLCDNVPLRTCLCYIYGNIELLGCTNTSRGKM